MQNQNSIYCSVEVLNLLLRCIIIHKLINYLSLLMFFQFLLTVLVVFIKQFKRKLVYVLKYIIIYMLQKKLTSCWTRIHSQLFTRQVNDLFEFVLPYGMVHILKLHEIVFNHTNFVHFI